MPTIDNGGSGNEAGITPKLTHLLPTSLVSSSFLPEDNWTKRSRKIADNAWHIAAGSAVIDGEVVVQAANGTTDFSVLQNELKGMPTKTVLVDFDLLYLNGYVLRKL